MAFSNPSAGVRRLSKKVCLLGDFAVGKTSLVRRFVEGRFEDKYLSTIGVKVDRKVLHLPGPGRAAILSLMLWDLAGGPEFAPIAPSYYRGASGAILVCDLTRPDTLDGIGRYAAAFLAACPTARLVLAANKTDLETERVLDDEALAKVASAHGAPIFLTSAKTGAQVEALFEELGRLLVG